MGLRVLEQPWQASEFDPRKHFSASLIVPDFDAIFQKKIFFLVSGNFIKKNGFHLSEHNRGTIL